MSSKHDHPGDALLRALAERDRVEREQDQQRADERWSRLCHGRASPDEEAALRARVDHDDEAARLAGLFGPLDDAFHQRVAGDIRRQLDAEQAASARPASNEPAQAWWRRRSMARGVALAAGVVIAVGLGLLARAWSVRSAVDVVGWSVASTRTRTPSGAPMETSDSVATVRPGGDLFVTIETEPPDAIASHRVRLFLRATDDGLHPVEIEHEVRSPGRVSLRAVLSRPDVARGEGALILAAHRSRAVSLAQVERTPRGLLETLWFGGWRRTEQRVRVEGAPDAPEVGYLGCSEVLGPVESPRCVVPRDGALRLWVEADGGEVEVSAGSRVWTAADAEVVDGRWVFGLRELDAPMLEVRDGLGVVRWRLALVSSAAVGATAGPAAGASSLSVAGREAFKAGAFARAADELEQAADGHGAAGRLSSQIDDLTLAYFTRFERLGQVGRAKAILDRLPKPPRGDTGSAYLIRYYQGHWALEAGDLGSGLRHLGQATRHAERAGWVVRRNMAEQLVARLLGRMGREAEASAVLVRLMGEIERLPDCDRVPLLNNLAWDRLRALAGRPSDGPRDVAAILTVLNAGLGWLDRCARDLGDERINLHLNLALAYLHAEQAEVVASHLTRVDQLSDDPAPRFFGWRLEIGSRLALLEGDAARSLALGERMATLATGVHGLEMRWRAATLRARALRLLGARDAALAAHAEAEGWLDQESELVPLDADRATFLSSRDDATRRYIDLLLELDQPSRAFAVARHARSRLYRGALLGAAPRFLPPDERAAWIATSRRYRAARVAHADLKHGALEQGAVEQGAVEQGAVGRADAAAHRDLDALATAALAPLRRRLDDLGLGVAAPAPIAHGEVVLLFQPLPDGGWVGFAALDDRVLAHRYVSLEAARDEERLLQPFATVLRTASLVRVLAQGDARNVDVHEQRLDGDALVATVPVVYALDLPRDVPASGGERTALVVAAPDGDLPGALDEVVAVRQALAGWRVASPDLVSPEALVEALGANALFHFAGHADFAGRNGLESHLRLAGDRRLSAGDLLALDVRVPPLVVLSACASARSSASATPGLGLAHAFLLRGAHMVVGATQPVDDQRASGLLTRFYGAWDGRAAGAPQALRQAQLATRETDPDWARFRVMTR